MFEFLVMIVAKLLGDYLLKSILCRRFPRAYLFFDESYSIYNRIKIFII